ncbi:MAG: hypothetical protein ABIF88_01915 [archaeon]
MAKQKKKCCSGAMMYAHIFAIVGIYVLTCGLIGSYSLSDVLTSAIFWGLIFIGIAHCMKHKIHHDMKK